MLPTGARLADLSVGDRQAGSIDDRELSLQQNFLALEGTRLGSELRKTASSSKTKVDNLNPGLHHSKTEIIMSLELVTIGSLVGISKGLIDIIKSAAGLLDRGPAKPKLDDELKKLYGRVEQLALQLEQCERLTRSVPAWLELANRMPMWGDIAAIESTAAQTLDRDLRSLLHESVRDHFSGTFFRADFNSLPEVPLQIEIFRSRLRSLDQSVSAIQPGNIAALKALWSQITTQFNDARNSANEIQRRAEDLQGALISELLDASRDGLKRLNAT